MQQEAAAQLSWYQKLRWRQTSHPEAIAAEKNLLSFASTKLDTYDVNVGPGKEDYMHTIVGGLNNTDSPSLVYLPGYGAGSGFMFRTMDALTAGFRSYFVDLLGTGLSGRPPYKAKNTVEAETFFIDSLDEWRKKQNLDKMILLGHSMGGYLSACYALKYPQHVQHLIMFCPAGVGHQPAEWQVPERLRSPWTLRGQLFRVATSAWDWGLTPGSFIRGLGPWGTGMVEKYVTSRFRRANGHALCDEETNAFKDYMYHVLAARGSGEYALRHILAPFAWPRHALEDRMDELQVPVTFIYGEFDWMDVKAARRVCSNLKEVRQQPLNSEDMKVVITPNAGHYPQIDQPGVLVKQIMESCREYLPLAAQQAILEEVARLPFSEELPADTAAQLKAEMRRNPIEAEAHVASDM